MGCGASSNAAPPLRDPLYGASPEQPPPPAPVKQGYTANEPLIDPQNVERAPQATTAAAAPPAPAATTAGVSFSFASADGKSSIQTTANAGGVEPGSLLRENAAAPAQKALGRVDLGALHAALSSGGDSTKVTADSFAAALRTLLPGADAPPAEAMAALFRSFDADGSGQVDESELVSGCSQVKTNQRTRDLASSSATP